MESVGDNLGRADLETEARAIRDGVARACSIDLSLPMPVTLTCLLHLADALDLRELEAALPGRMRALAGGSPSEARTTVRFDPADSRSFRNQLTLRIVQSAEGCDARRAVSCKLFARGLVHMTGPRTLEEASSAWKTLRHLLQGLFETSPPALTVVRFSPVMMNSSCKVTKIGAEEDMGLAHVIVAKKVIGAVRCSMWCQRSSTPIKCAYDPSVYSGIKIKRDVGTLLIFSSGSVVISSRTTEGTWTMWAMLGALLKMEPSALKQVTRGSTRDKKSPERRPAVLTTDYEAQLLAS
jgi:hypothetical protein